MKRFISAVLCLSTLFCFIGCNGVSRNDYAALQSELDANAAQLQEKNVQIEELSEGKDIYANRLAQLESELASLKDIMEKLTSQNEAYGETLSENTDKIAELEKNVNSAESKYKEMQESYEHYMTYIAPYPLEEWIESQKSVPEELPVYIEGSIEQSVGYRHRRLINLSHDDNFMQALWKVRGITSLAFPDGEEMGEQYLAYIYWEREDGWLGMDEMDEMPIISVIKYFRITRKEFNEIIEILREWGWSKTRFYYELPNADILYTFDNDIINNFYRMDADKIIEYEEWLEIIKEEWLNGMLVSSDYPTEYMQYMTWLYEHDYNRFLENLEHYFFELQTYTEHNYYEKEYAKYGHLL